MTTITSEQSLLEQALNALLLPCDRWNKQQFLIVKGAIESLNAALAAPATASEQPSWHDAPTCAGLWANSVNWRVHKVLEETLGAYQDTNARWFGPIPKDKP